MSDSTEAIRRVQQAELNADQRHRQELEAEFGKVWNTDELREEFDVSGFLAPYVVVTRKADNVSGSLQFRHSPRLYFNFVADGRS